MSSEWKQSGELTAFEGKNKVSVYNYILIVWGILTRIFQQFVFLKKSGFE